MEPPKPPPPAPLKKLTMTLAARYIRTQHCIDITRQTLYNWANKGVKGEFLRVLKIGPRTFFTTKEWVDAFIASTSR